MSLTRGIGSRPPAKGAPGPGVNTTLGGSTGSAMTGAFGSMLGMAFTTLGALSGGGCDVVVAGAFGGVIGADALSGGFGAGGLTGGLAFCGSGAAEVSAVLGRQRPG